MKEAPRRTLPDSPPSGTTSQPPEAARPSVPGPDDSAVSQWDPWLYALYIREIAKQRKIRIH